MKKAIVSLMIAVAIGLAFFIFKRPGSPYMSFAHPSGHFQVVVYQSGFRFFALPGQGSDAPGHVKLLDGSGHELQSAKIDMVQMVDHVEWRAHSVWVMPGLVWPLPDQHPLSPP
jgi:hypothetical protein